MVNIILNKKGLTKSPMQQTDVKRAGTLFFRRQERGDAMPCSIWSGTMVTLTGFIVRARGII